MTTVYVACHGLTSTYDFQSGLEDLGVDFDLFCGPQLDGVSTELTDEWREFLKSRVTDELEDEFEDGLPPLRWVESDWRPSEMVGSNSDFSKTITAYWAGGAEKFPVSSIFGYRPKAGKVAAMIVIQQRDMFGW